jgi:hypothetical protein
VIAHACQPAQPIHLGDEEPHQHGGVGALLHLAPQPVDVLGVRFVRERVRALAVGEEASRGIAQLTLRPESHMQLHDQPRVPRRDVRRLGNSITIGLSKTKDGGTTDVFTHTVTLTDAVA